MANEEQALELKELWPEPPRSSGRYKLCLTKDQCLLFDNRALDACGKPRCVNLGSDIRNNARLLRLIRELVWIANRRHGQFDALLNATEAFLLLFKGLKDFVPDLVTFGVFEPLVDLKACLTDLVSQGEPTLISRRSPLFDGGVRHLETYQEGEQLGRKIRLPSDKPIRLYVDQQRARVLFAYRVLRQFFGRKKEDGRLLADVEMNKLLSKAKIQQFDDDVSGVIELEDVAELWKRRNESGSRLGLRYSYEHLSEKVYKERLARLTTRADAVSFAAELIEKVRCDQPSKFPATAEELEKIDIARLERHRRLMAQKLREAKQKQSRTRNQADT